LIIGDRAAVAFPQAAPAAKGDLIARMEWMNSPESVKRDGDKSIVRSRPKTDFWRKTFYGYITDNGHFFYLRARGDFTFQARVNGKYAALYDQAGLMERRLHARFLGLVDDARSFRRGAGLVARGPQERFD
jgi:Protein of unknown function (DUF1349)